MWWTLFKGSMSVSLGEVPPSYRCSSACKSIPQWAGSKASLRSWLPFQEPVQRPCTLPVHQVRISPLHPLCLFSLWLSVCLGFLSCAIIPVWEWKSALDSSWLGFSRPSPSQGLDCCSSSQPLTASNHITVSGERILEKSDCVLFIVVSHMPSVSSLQSIWQLSVQWEKIECIKSL